MIRTTPYRRSRSLVVAAFALGLGLLLSTPAGAPIVNRMVLKGFFIAGSGSTVSQPYTFDTDILLTYTAGLAGAPAGTGATTSLYLYDASGEPLTSGTGQVVCAPCLFQSGSGGTTPRRVSISVDDLIEAHGGFSPLNPTRQGFAVMDVNGDAGHLAAMLRVRTSLDTPGQPSAAPPIAPKDVRVQFLANLGQPSTYVMSKLDGIDDWNVRDWSIMSATYLGGIGGIPAGGGATLQEYLFNEDGTPQGGLSTPVCAPCTYALGSGGSSGVARNIQIRIPAFPTALDAGFAVFRVAGADPSAVVLEQTEFDSIPTPVPMTRVRSSRQLDPLPQSSGSLAVSEPDVPGATLALIAGPNPAAGEMTFAFDLVHATTIDLEVFDAAGRRVATVASGSRAAGHHELRWDRRNTSGNALAAGIYYGRLRASDGSRVTRLVFLPE